jgi:hypothetical protein
MSSNLLTNISINLISQISTSAYTEFYKFTDLDKYEKEANFLRNISYISFSNNTLTSVKFDFKQIYTYMTSLVEIDELVYLTFTSLMFYENKVKCSCDIYDDFKFLVDIYQSKFYVISLFNRKIYKNRCFDEQNQSHNIVEHILKKNFTLFKHCNKENRLKYSVLIIYIFIGYFLIKNL